MKKSFVAAVALVLSGATLSSAARAQYFQVPTPYVSPYPAPYGSGNIAPSVVYGQRCQSQVGLCMMGASGPVGSPCFCMTPYGAAAGMIVQ